MRLICVASLATACALTVAACARAEVPAPAAQVAPQPQPATMAHGLPDGQGKDVVQTACTQCHGVDLITRQLRSREEWTEVVARMIGAGAQLSDDDYEQVINYLSTRLGPKPAAGGKAPM